jgi:hypothetical protein
MGAGDISPKSEEKIPIDNLNEIYKLADQLKATAEWYAKNLGSSSNGTETAIKGNSDAKKLRIV